MITLLLSLALPSPSHALVMLLAHCSTVDGESD